MKTVADCLYAGLMAAGLLAGLFLYRIAARRLVEWLIEQPWFGRPLPEKDNHAPKSE